MGDLNRIGRAGAIVDGKRMVRFDAPRCENCQCGLGSTQRASTELRWASYNSSPEPMEGEVALLRISSRGLHEATALIFGLPLAVLLAFLLIADTLLIAQTKLIAHPPAALLAFGLASGALWLWWRLVRLFGPRVQQRLAVRLERPPHDGS